MVVRDLSQLILGIDRKPDIEPDLDDHADIERGSKLGEASKAHSAREAKAVEEDGEPILVSHERIQVHNETLTIA